MTTQNKTTRKPKAKPASATPKPPRRKATAGFADGRPATSVPKAAAANSVARGDKSTPARPAPRPGTRLATVVSMLGDPEGATLAALVDATGWQAHSVRGAIAGALKKKYGLTITSTVTDGGRVYRIASQGGAA